MSRNPKLPAYHGLARVRENGEPQWSGQTRFLPERLAEPLRKRGPGRVFVCDMSDLFHETVSNEQIAAVFGVMAASPRLTFQVLTKRAHRMREWFEWINGERIAAGMDLAGIDRVRFGLGPFACDASPRAALAFGMPWPLPNVWCGVTVEDQRRADERIPHLLAVPAAVRFLSCEPLLEELDLRPWAFNREAAIREAMAGPAALNRDQADAVIAQPIDWVIVGGESGPHARPFDLQWARRLRDQCAAAGVPYFFKQTGAHPVVDGFDLREGDCVPELAEILDKAGAAPDEWPEDLRVRQMPGDPRP